MKKQELFSKAIEAADNEIQAIEAGLFDFANYFDELGKELYQEIKRRGLEGEYSDYIVEVWLYKGGCNIPP